MEFPWQSGSGSPHADLNLLDGDNLLIDLDDKTLQCIVGGVALPPVDQDPDSLPGPSSGGGKRRRATDQQFNSWLQDTFASEGDGEGDCGTGEEEPSSTGNANAAAGNGRRLGKRGRPMSDAAVAKANRERARRERLNEYLDELAKLCDPSGKGIKADRVSVVADAIRVVQQLRVENNQLKQLNKFLEERTASFERAKAQAMFQNAMQFQYQQPQQQQQEGATACASAAAAAVPVTTAPPVLDVSTSAAMAPSTSGAAPITVQHVLVPVSVGSLGAHMLSLKQEHLGPGGATVMAAVPQAALPPGAPPVAWLPAPDLTQDQKLRPPAA